MLLETSYLKKQIPQANLWYSHRRKKSAPDSAGADSNTLVVTTYTEKENTT